MHPQYLRSHLLLLVLIFTSCISCFSSYEENPTSNLFHQSSNRYGYKSSFPSLVNNYKTNLLPRLRQVRPPASRVTIVNVDDFGAKADGKDDSQAFNKVWKKACSFQGSVVIVVPKNKIYHLKPINFSGPCKSDIIFKIYGTIKASVNKRDYKDDTRHWITFNGVKNLRVKGGGTINGNGKIWWESSCKVNKNLPCIGAPTAVTFEDCKNLIVANLRFKNAQQMHLTFRTCVNVRVLNLMVIAPGKSPNTDGIHVSGTQNIRIRKSVIRTGDDCISIVSGSKNVQATDIVCGPGHGISIGSLGAGNSEAEVSNVVVNRAILSGTTNGVRNKTWQGGSGYAKNIVFQNVIMRNVSNPIIIDQNYCDRKSECPPQVKAVKVSNVLYKNIKGTSASEVAVKLDCSKTVPCQSILMQDINLAPEENGYAAEASCDNVKLESKGKVSPQCFLE